MPLFDDNSRFINDSHYEFGKMFFCTYHFDICLIKMLLSNRQVTLDFKPWSRELVQRCLNTIYVSIKNIL